MNKKLHSVFALALGTLVLIFTSSRLPADTGTCGGAISTLPFTDVAGNLFFCQIAEAFFSGLTNGTSATTYSPSDSVRREQMAAFIVRTHDSALRRGSRRAATRQWATPAELPMTGRTTIGSTPRLCQSDGLDIWVADETSNDVKRVRASDGSLLGTWTGATSAYGILVARGRVYVAGTTSPGRLYSIDPSSAPGPVTTLSSTLGVTPLGITTDGRYIWTKNNGSISRVDPNTGATLNITNGFSASFPGDLLFDGSNLWAVNSDNTLKKLDSDGNIVQSVPLGTNPQFTVFDGANIWVTSFDSFITVVRARDGAVLATLTGNGLNHPFGIAFDGERILAANNAGSSLSLWKAADLTPIGVVPAPNAFPFGACSDGINFWITLNIGQLARF